MQPTRPAPLAELSATNAFRGSSLESLVAAAQHATGQAGSGAARAVGAALQAMDGIWGQVVVAASSKAGRILDNPAEPLQDSFVSGERRRDVSAPLYGRRCDGRQP